MEDDNRCHGDRWDRSVKMYREQDRWLTVMNWDSSVCVCVVVRSRASVKLLLQDEHTFMNWNMKSTNIDSLRWKHLLTQTTFITANFLRGLFSLFRSVESDRCTHTHTDITLFSSSYLPLKISPEFIWTDDLSDTKDWRQPCFVFVAFFLHAFSQL